MRPRILRPKRLATLALLAASIAIGVWWMGHIPYDPVAIYRPVPSSATMVGRHLDLPGRWMDLLANPLALALMRTAGVDTGEAAWLVADDESRAWFEKLAGREGVLAYLPGRFGAAPAWMAVSHLGGESQKLRWQLSLFKVPGFSRMTQFPGRSVWRVDTPDLDPRQKLVIAFGEGVIMACLSENLFAMAEVLGAYDGTVRRLMEEELSFKRFVETDVRGAPDRFWLRDESDWASPGAPGIWVEVPVLRGEAMSLRVVSEGAAPVPEGGARPPDFGALARRLGQAPCAVAHVGREPLERLVSAPGIQRDVRFALRMALEIADDSVAVVLMDGDLGGRLAWGAMRSLGLSGLRVPTVLLATPAPDAAEAAAAIQRMLDASNARYRGAFMLRPVAHPAATVHVLESAAGDEWVDALERSDRPAYVVVDGWLLAASNLDALQKIVRSGADTDALPAWAAADPGAAASGWLDLERSGKMARDAIATWSLAQVFLEGGSSQAVREQLNEAKAWIDAFAPFGEARWSLARRAGETTLAVDLGLSGAGALDRMPAP
jgi:hypothetical protein